MGLNLYHNNKRVMHNYERNKEYQDSMSNALTLELQEGDVVYTCVSPQGLGVSDDGTHYSTFRGFLLFPV